MPRKSPNISPPKIDLTSTCAAHPGYMIKLSTITPMFGGSTDPRKSNPKNPVAARSVRGHLRFWWRALNGHRFTKTEEMFNAESQIWGSAAGAGGQSRVSIEVANPTQCVATYCAKKLEKPNLDLKYGGYGLLADNQRPAALGLYPFEFSLRINCDPDIWASDVHPALNTWVLLGGIGARWRRGFGSLEMKDPVSTTVDLREIKKESGSARHSLAPCFWLLGKETNDPEKAWKEALKVLRDARTGGDYRIGKGRGISPWPEANTLRRLAGCPGADDTIPLGFPRTDLGLPLEFFKPKETNSKQRSDSDKDPSHSQFTPNGSSRMASPIVVKAVAVPDQSGRYRPLIYAFQAPHIWDKGLLCNGKQVPNEQVCMPPSETKRIQIMKGSDARKAVLDFAKEKHGFQQYHMGVFHR